MTYMMSSGGCSMCVLAGMETWRLLCGSPDCCRTGSALAEGCADYLPHVSFCDSLAASPLRSSPSSCTMLPTEPLVAPRQLLSKGTGYSIPQASSGTKEILSTLCSGCWHTSLSRGCIRATCRQLRMCLRREQTLLAASLRTSALIGERMLRKSRAAIGLVCSRLALTRFRQSQGQQTEVPRVSLENALRAFGFAYSARTWEEPDEREMGMTLRSPRPEAQLVTSSDAFSERVLELEEMITVLTRGMVPGGITGGPSFTADPNAWRQDGDALPNIAQQLPTPSASQDPWIVSSEGTGRAASQPPLTAFLDFWDPVLTAAREQIAGLTANLVGLSIMGQLGLVEVWEHSSCQASSTAAFIHALKLPVVGHTPLPVLEEDRRGHIMVQEMENGNGTRMCEKVWSFMDMGSDLVWGEQGVQLGPMTLLNIRENFKPQDVYRNPPTVALLVKKPISCWAIFTVLLANQSREKFKAEEKCFREAMEMCPEPDLWPALELTIKGPKPRVVIPDLLAQVNAEVFMTEEDINLARFDAHYLRKKDNQTLRRERPPLYGPNHSHAQCHWDLFTWNHSVWKSFLTLEKMVHVDHPRVPKIGIEEMMEWDQEASAGRKAEVVPANHERVLWALNDLFQAVALGDQLSFHQEEIMARMQIRVHWFAANRMPPQWHGMRRRNLDAPDW